MLNIHCLKRYCERIIIFVDIYFFQYPTVGILHDLFPHLLLGIHCNTHKRYLQLKIKKISTSRRKFMKTQRRNPNTHLIKPRLKLLFLSTKLRWTALKDVCNAKSLTPVMLPFSDRFLMQTPSLLPLLCCFIDEWKHKRYLSHHFPI